VARARSQILASMTSWPVSGPGINMLERAHWLAGWYHSPRFARNGSLVPRRITFHYYTGLDVNGSLTPGRSRNQVASELGLDVRDQRQSTWRDGAGDEKWGVNNAITEPQHSAEFLAFPTMSNAEIFWSVAFRSECHDREWLEKATGMKLHHMPRY
jgi:hypothetical protein